MSIIAVHLFLAKISKVMISNTLLANGHCPSCSHTAAVSKNKANMFLSR